MDVTADLFICRDHIDQFIGQILWMGGHKTDEKIPFNSIDLPQQCRKIHPVSFSFTIGVYILSQQGDLFITLCHQLTRFC